MKISNNIQAQIDKILKENTPCIKWDAEKIEVLRKYKGKCSVKGIVKIFQLLYPDNNYTFNSIESALKRMI